MDNRYYENVISEMKPFFEQNGFKEEKDGSFASDKKSVSVKYNESAQLYELYIADIDEENKVGEYYKANAWLFDDSQNAKDAESVGMDFVNTLRKSLGIKAVRNSAVGGIDLPTASKSDVIDIQGFTKKMLDFFPELKDEYKAHIAQFGNFLYLNFFGEQLVPKLKELFKNGTKKQIKKFNSVLEDAYVKGNSDAVNVTIAVLSAAGLDDESVDAAIKEMLSENNHFLTSYNTFKPVLAKNKKLKTALVK